MNKFIKATILYIIVALLIVIILLGGIELFFGQEIDNAITTLNQFVVKTEISSENTELKFDDHNQSITTYPEYGTQYATIEIPKIDINLPVYYGETLDILKKGVGHDSGSYFPGEGGTIIYMGHNSKKVFRRFSELQIGNEIKITTDYGVFNYKIYDMKLINESETDKLPIQKDKEILMIYTCYPFNNIGYATQRYVIYAELEK